MAPIDQKQLRRLELSRCRGTIVRLLHTSKPKPLAFGSIMYLLDKLDIPLSARRLSEELEFLRSVKFIRVFPVGGTEAFDDVAQAKLIQRYAASEGEMNDEYAAVLTSKGVNFHEGFFEEVGVTRVG